MSNADIEGGISNGGNTKSRKFYKRPSKFMLKASSLFGPFIFFGRVPKS